MRIIVILLRSRSNLPAYSSLVAQPPCGIFGVYVVEFPDYAG